MIWELYSLDFGGVPCSIIIIMMCYYLRSRGGVRKPWLNWWTPLLLWLLRLFFHDCTIAELWYGYIRIMPSNNHKLATVKTTMATHGPNKLVIVKTSTAHGHSPNNTYWAYSLSAFFFHDHPYREVLLHSLIFSCLHYGIWQISCTSLIFHAHTILKGDANCSVFLLIL